MGGTVRHDGILSYGYGIVPLMVLVDNRLNDGDRTVYGLLANHARGFEKPARPLQSSMAKMLGVEVPTISLHTTKLQECGYIEKTKGRGGRVEYLMLMNSEIPLQGEMFPDIIRKRKGKSEATGIGEKLKRLETIYFEFFIAHPKNKAKKKPDYSYKTDRGIFKKYLLKYDEETVAGMIRAYFNHPFGIKCSFSVRVFQTVANDLLLKVSEGKGGKGFDGFKKSGQV